MNTADNGPKNGDFVRYIKQLEQEQFQTTARLMQQTQARSPGEVQRPAVPAAQKAKIFTSLAQGNTTPAGKLLAQKINGPAGTNTAPNRAALYGLSAVAVVLGAVVVAKLLDIPFWFALIGALMLALNYVKKSKQQK
jgi:hypothetical protein